MAAVLIFTGCSDENKVESESSSSDKEILATSEGHSSTRTQVGGIAGDGCLKMQWLSHENIGVFSNTGEITKFSSHNDTPSDWASFKGTMNGEPQKAYYPYDNTVSSSIIPVNIPALQNYKDVSSIAPYDYKAATSIEQRTLGYYRMSFRQMVTIVCMNIDLSMFPQLEKNEKLSKIEMVGNTNLAGTYTYDLNNLDAGLTPEAASNSVAVSFVNNPMLSGALTAYMIVAPGSQAGSEYTFNITTDKHTLTFKTNLLVTLEAGKFYNLPINTEILTKNNVVVNAII